MRIARFLVQGVDVWLNNPRRPLEASGTSGHEGGRRTASSTSASSTAGGTRASTGDNGWAIGGRETNPDEGAQDWADAQDLYRILEEEIVPALLRPRRERRPARWLAAHAPLDRDARSGGSRRRGCSTSTSSGCTCQPAGSPSASPVPSPR